MEVVAILMSATKAMTACGGVPKLGLVGSSLGGFFALQVHLQTGLPTVVLNPCLRPEITLPDRGFEDSFLSGFAALGYQLRVRTFPHVRCIICEDDEVIDQSDIEEYGFDLIRFKQGGHRMENFVDLLPGITEWLGKMP